MASESLSPFSRPGIANAPTSNNPDKPDELNLLLSQRETSRGQEASGDAPGSLPSHLACPNKEDYPTLSDASNVAASTTSDDDEDIELQREVGEQKNDEKIEVADRRKKLSFAAVVEESHCTQDEGSVQEHPQDDETSSRWGFLLVTWLCRCCPFLLSVFISLRSIGAVVKAEVVNEGRGVSKFVGKVVMGIMLPSWGFSVLLFYVAGNPLLFAGASASWWLLFLGVRQVTTLFIALLLEHIITDMCSIRSRVTERLLGAYAALFVVLANGWAATLVLWALVDYALLAGDSKFAKHWLYWQSSLGLFREEENPAGNVVQSSFYLRLLGAAVLCGALTTIKRVLVTFYLERRSLNRFAAQLDSVLCRVAVISELAQYAVETSLTSDQRHSSIGGVAAASAVASKLAKASKKKRHGNNKSSLKRKGGRFRRRSLGAAVAPFQLEDDEKLLEGRSKQKETEHEREGMGNLRKTGIVDNEDQDDDRQKDREQERDGMGNVRKVGVVDDKDEDDASKEATSDESDVDVAKILHEVEGPDLGESLEEQEVTVANILRFRRAVATLDDRYPFSSAFGNAATRVSCAASSLRLFDTLRRMQEYETPRRNSFHDKNKLSFRALEAVSFSQEDKQEAMASMFRPDKDGYLTHEDFGKSIDAVWGNIRQFRAALNNSRQIDTQFENFVSIVFNGFLVVLLLKFMNVDVEETFFSFSGVFFSFSFLFGDAASKFFEGVLVIFLERPFDIGDEISIVAADRLDDRSSQNVTTQWIVDAVSLAKTTVRYTSTGEMAYVPNSQLAYHKIINTNRPTPKTIVKVWYKVDLNVPFSKIVLWKEQMELYVQERPQIWVGMDHFRCVGMDSERGLLEYEFGLIHRDRWNNGKIRTDQMYAYAFCNEIAKSLHIRYMAPPLPIVLHRSDVENVMGGVDGGKGEEEEEEVEIDLLTSLGAPPTKGSNQNQSAQRTGYHDPFHESYHASVGYLNEKDVEQALSFFNAKKEKS